MKRIEPKTRPLLDLGSASATDIVMNLFVFFFIAFSLLATFDRKKAAAEEHALEIDPPASGRADAFPDPAAVVVEIAQGRIFVEGRAVEAGALTSAVQAVLGPGARPVVVRADRSLPLGETVAHLDRIWAAKPSSVSLATVGTQQPAAPAAHEESGR